ncbi:ABC transporter [Fibrobacter sp. UWT2]|uniref:nSTAND3 domain-containing NTPase n=1 Tax=Fibrobacter sp. UWT2 TaxID=1896224 RepID=UPI00091A6D3D|nr:ATP-binding protein [Fibrobacter sp. UWT2]SHK84574.1 ABC transporter [Fibrobacter sp. UWT2]
MNYDFSVLNDIDFEQMVNKLLIGKTRVVEQYAEGRDSGIDGLACDIPKRALIQAKHYLKSGFNQLKNKIEKDELPKIQKKRISCYVLATSLNLSQSQAEILRNLIKGAVSNVVVLGAVSISSLLDNDTATLKSTVKLWATNADLVRAVLKPANMNCFYELQNRWEGLNNVFVETPDVKNVVDSLEKNHVAVIAGEPGVGKTTLAEYICLLYYKEGFEVHFFEDEFSHDDYDLSDTEKKIVFYFDDFLGSTYYDCYSGKQESSIVNFLKRISKEKNKRFVLTSRTNIIQKACLYSQCYREYRLAKKAYIVSVGEYSDSTKVRILYNHLLNSNIDADEIANIVKNKAYNAIIKHRNFNPRLIHFITKQENFEDSRQESYLEFVNKTLDDPKEIWENCFTRHLDASQRLLVQLVVANRGKILECLLRDAYSRALTLMGIKKPDQERNDFDYVLSGCLRSILRKDVEISSGSKEFFVSVFNPSVSDYVLPTILERDVIVKLSLALGTIDSIEVIEYNNEKIVDVQSVYGELLNNCPKNEWTGLKIHLVRLLGFECGLVPNLIESIHEGDDILIEYNKFNFFCIVLDNLSKYDFSDFIMCFSYCFCDDYHDFGAILEGYKSCPFVKDYVVEFLQECLFESLEIDIDNILVNETDAFICTSIEEIKEELEIFLEEIQDDYPFLKKKEIDNLRKNVDFKGVIEGNLKFFHAAMNSGPRHNKEKEEKNIDALFDGLM